MDIKGRIATRDQDTLQDARTASGSGGEVVNTSDPVSVELLEKILCEIQILNTHMAMITGDEIKSEDKLC